MSGIAFDATGKLFANDYSNGRLGTLNLATGAYTNIGSIGVASTNRYGVLAFSNGTLYDATYNVFDSLPGKLNSLNTATGLGITIGSTDNRYQSMALFDVQNVLYGIGGKSFFSINTTTAALTDLGAITGNNLPGSFTAATALTTNNVPEPSSLGLFAIGSLLMGFTRKRSKSAD